MENTQKEKQIIPIGGIIISVKKHIEDEIEFKNGTKIYLDSSYNPQNHSITNGIIEYSFYPNELPIGSEVIFHRTVTLKKYLSDKGELTMGEGLLDKDKKLYLIDYYFKDKTNSQLFLIKDKNTNKWINVNREVSFYEPIPYEKQTITKSNLIYNNEKGHEGKYKLGLAGKRIYPSVDFNSNSDKETSISFSLGTDKEITVYNPNTGYIINVDGKDVLAVPNRQLIGSIDANKINDLEFKNIQKRM